LINEAGKGYNYNMIRN